MGIFGKPLSIKFHEKQSNGSRVVPCGQTDRHDEANSRFPLFCESVQKMKNKTTKCICCILCENWYIQLIFPHYVKSLFEGKPCTSIRYTRASTKRCKTSCCERNRNISFPFLSLFLSTWSVFLWAFSLFAFSFISPPVLFAVILVLPQPLCCRTGT